MAEILLSPGVSLMENDTSQITSGPITAGLSLVGPTVKGRQNIPTLVTSYSDFKGKFGDVFESASYNYEYLTSVTARNYFQQGGQTILVTRICSSSFTPATASINNNQPVIPGVEASVDLTQLDSYGSLADYLNYEVKVVYPTTLGNKLLRFIQTEPDINGDLPVDDTEGNENVFFYTAATITGFPVVDVSTALIAKMNAVQNVFTATWDAVNAQIDIVANTFGDIYNNIFFTTGAVLTRYVVGGYVLEFYVDPASTGVLGYTTGGTNGTTGYGFTLETIAQGIEQNSIGSSFETNNALPNGTIDNIRWEVITSDINSGTFSLVIRQGNDNQLNKTVLESWTNLSLDPNSANFISAVIGDKTQKVDYDSTVGQFYLNESGSYPNNSRYVRVKEVSALTPNYFMNSGLPNPAYATYLPVVGSGSLGGAFGGATGNDLNKPNNYYNQINNINTQGITLPADSYAVAVSLLANQEEYDYQLLATPGLMDNCSTHTPVISDFISNTEARGDSFYIMDLVAYGATVGAVSNQAATRNTNYAAGYWPWVQVLSQATGKLVWVPASVVMPGVYTFNDRVAAEWFAPAGLNRGGLGGALQAERKLSTNDRDTLYTNKVNPIATFPGVGLVAYGQKTLQTQASALDRVNVRRLLINLKRFIGNVATTLLFEQNTITTRNNFLAQVNPYLEQVQQKQGLYAYKVVMDDSNNTPETIDRNQLVGAIYVQPTKTVEYIYLTFNITPTGVSFS
jgi:hypothetical protein